MEVAMCLTLIKKCSVHKFVMEIKKTSCALALPQPLSIDHSISSIK